MLGKPPSYLGTSWQRRFKDETGFSGLALLDAGFSLPPWNHPQPPNPYPEIGRKLGN